MSDEHEHDHDHQHAGEEGLDLELDTQSRIFLEMRAQNLELLKIAAQVSGFSGNHSPLKPGDMKHAMKGIWEVYAEFYSWIDPEESGDDEEDEVSVGESLETVAWVGDAETGRLSLIDQTLLPIDLVHITLNVVDEVWEAIKSLRVRGAPAIGIAAAYGVVVGAREGSGDDAEVRESALEASKHLRTSRPTAVNLFWALDRMDRVTNSEEPDASGSLLERLLVEAKKIHDEDREVCRAIGAFGAALVRSGQGILTHCNAGGLATADYGTALAVMFSAHEQGKKIQVFADETRPLLQGSRLTAWELQKRGIPVTLICDNMAAQVMKEGKVQMVVVGADRIAANGDSANKIGTYGVALLAKAHGIPFYVAAPSSTFDLTLSSGDSIPIEQRDPREVTQGFGKLTAPEGIAVYNPAFDVTPASLIAGIITEKGVIQPVDEATIRETLASDR